ncbi:putative mitochondrial carrier C29A3.11c [Golovinomyces cichoracearum]|uniref:Putative mitochondrial carrier C29A3.11c n=1 Tax=Golovinomyces cichoracearum TaxID=62708 RepID=A0A420HVL4_9PEZI|nr:putative mitochondrial carrier C29A3.11c [Golovinomyces cichoracearum]
MPLKSEPPESVTARETMNQNIASPRHPSHEKRFIKRYRTEISASMGSIMSTFVAFPLDTVKTRMQTYQYTGFADCVQHTFKTEGYQGFFRGVVAPLLSVTLVRTVSFSIYQRSKYSYSAWLKQNFGTDPLLHVTTPGKYPNLFTMACFGAAGATAGSFITMVSCPFELTKLSAQVSHLVTDRSSSICESSEARKVAATYQNKGTFMTARNIIRYRGISGLYTGFYLHLTRDTIGTAAYFMTYESAKQILTTISRDKSTANPFAVAIAGGFCGVASWALIYPIDSAKSIYQSNSLKISKGQPTPKPPKIQFRNKRMYRGLGVSMGRSCLVNSVFFSTFEFVKKQVVALDD